MYITYKLLISYLATFSSTINPCSQFNHKYHQQEDKELNNNKCIYECGYSLSVYPEFGDFTYL